MEVSSAAAWLAGPDADRTLASGTVAAAAYRSARPYLDRNRSASRGVVRRSRAVHPSALAWRSRRAFRVNVGGTREVMPFSSSLQAFKPSSLQAFTPFLSPSLQISVARRLA